MAGKPVAEKAKAIILNLDHDALDFCLETFLEGDYLNRESEDLAKGRRGVLLKHHRQNIDTAIIQEAVDFNNNAADV